MRPSRTENAAGPPDRAAVVQYDRPKQVWHPRGECSSAALRPGQRPTHLALVMPHAPIVTRAPSDWDRPLGREQSNMRRWQQTWEGGKHTLHVGAIVRKRVDSSVVESGSCGRAGPRTQRGHRIGQWQYNATDRSRQGIQEENAAPPAHAPIVTRAPPDWDRPSGQEQSNLRRRQQMWEGGNTHYMVAPLCGRELTGPS